MGVPTEPRQANESLHRSPQCPWRPCAAFLERDPQRVAPGSGATCPIPVQKVKSPADQQVRNVLCDVVAQLMELQCFLMG